MHHHTDRITHTSAFITPVVEHWLEREIAQWATLTTPTTTTTTNSNNNVEDHYDNDDGDDK